LRDRGVRCLLPFKLGGGGQREGGVDLGDGGPGGGGGLAIPLAEQFARLGGEFLGAAEMLRSGHWCSSCQECPVLE
jgi:hypothetical protein